jgi:hypothetical protein
MFKARLCIHMGSTGCSHLDYVQMTESRWKSPYCALSCTVFLKRSDTIPHPSTFDGLVSLCEQGLNFVSLAGAKAMGVVNGWVYARSNLVI